ncbi:MAG: LysR family transcriptional regulator [Clostridia bacterium]|nr:LysR family transcriptional regulator [Clostridia bacterium]
MEIRTLRYFLTVAREENMTRAAEILHVTQPTLSKAMKALEDELGKKLFTRHSFSIRLTDEGRLLRSRAEDLVSMADRIEREFVSLDDISGGDIFFGLAESYRIRTLAREIRAFRRRYPDLRYHITSGDTEQVTEKLDKGLLDFAVLAEEPDAVKYDFLAFPDADVWGLVFRADDPLAAKERITAEDIAGLPLFCSEQSWRGDIPRWCGERMREMRLEGSFRLSYNGSMFAMEGLGYLLTFDRLIDTSPSSGLVFRPLWPRLETRLYLIWKKYQTFSPIAERFLRQLRADFGAAPDETLIGKS